MKIHDIPQDTPEWKLLRAGLPTGSAFSCLVDSNGRRSDSFRDYAMQLAGELYAEEPLEDFSGNRHTERGKKLEPEARSYYEMLTGNEVRQVGFVTEDMGRWGCSPDGLVDDDGTVEFKCLSHKEHFKVLLHYRKTGRSPATYKQQTQGEMLICERDWNDLVFYHPKLPCIVVRQEPDTKFVASLKEQLNAVIAERNVLHNILKEF